jgi:23S rRNA (pseudouridine1915-N3)-methyltransferase
MKISLLTLGHKMPEWVNTAFKTYNDRLPNHLKIQIKELTAVSRQKGLTVSQIKAQEAELISKQLKADSYNIALDEHGKAMKTTDVAKQLTHWQMNGQDVNIIVGGADGLDASVLELVQQTWSLSKLTFPHQLVKVIVAEQIYRAHSLLNNHPYHRE